MGKAVRILSLILEAAAVGILPIGLISAQTQEASDGGGSGSGGGFLLSSLPELDAFRQSNRDIITRQGNVDVIPAIPPSSSSAAAAAAASTFNTTAICHLPYIFPFTQSGRAPWNGIGSYDGAFAIALAMQHLNTGDGSIVPAASNYNARCNVRFTMEMHDTELQESIAVDQIIDITDRPAGGEERLPCAILGSARSAVSIPVSIISGLRGYPQLSPISTSPALDDGAQYPLFGRTIPSDDGTAVPFVLFMRNVLNVRYLAVLHINDSYGNAFATGVQVAAQQYAPDMNIQTFDLNVDANAENVRRQVGFLKETRYTFFFGILFPESFVDRIMIEAHSQGIAGTGLHNWIFADAAGGGIPGRDFERGSVLERVYRGTSMLSAVGGVTGMDLYDKLTAGMAELKNDADVEYIRSILPTYPEEEGGDGLPMPDHDIVLTDDAFLSAPGLVAPFLYDATIALGLAACDAAADSIDGTYFDGRTHFDRVVKNQFNGTSGEVIFNPATGTRNPKSALFSLVNFVDNEGKSTDDTVQYKRVESSVFRSGEWEELVPYVFNDGTTNIPRDLPEVETDSNYLSPGLRAVGLTLCAIIVALSVGFAVWAHVRRKGTVVKASQPIFLFLICAGAIFMGSSIIPLVIDRGIASQEGCNIACISFPWLLATGFSVVFSALFTKTHRINRIFKNAENFKRVKVTTLDVIKPMATILALNILVLSLWTALDPLYFDTVTVSEDPFGRPTETYGICKSDHYAYVATLGAINLGALSYTLYEAYVAIGISTEYAESEYIFKAMVLILLVFFIGIPVLVIARENPAAYVFVFAGIIFVVCCSILLLIFVPKFIAAKEADNKKKAKAERTAATTANSNPNGSTSRFSSNESKDGGLKIVRDSRKQQDLEKEIKVLRRTLLKQKRECDDQRNEGNSPPASRKASLQSVPSEVSRRRLSSGAVSWASDGVGGDGDVENQ